MDQWKGRNIYIITGTQQGRLVKIQSNSPSQLTLCEALALAPAVGVLAGIKLEVKQARLTHKAGTGAGYGDAYTTKDIRTPHTLTISKAGYQTYQDVVAINRKLDLEVALKRIDQPPAPWEYAND